MMSRLLLTAATAAAVAVVTAGDIPAEADEFDETNVITMTGENFNDMLEMHRPIMVDFYACAPSSRCLRLPRTVGSTVGAVYTDLILGNASQAMVRPLQAPRAGVRTGGGPAGDGL